MLFFDVFSIKILYTHQKKLYRLLMCWIHQSLQLLCSSLHHHRTVCPSTPFLFHSFFFFCTFCCIALALSCLWSNKKHKVEERWLSSPVGRHHHIKCTTVPSWETNKWLRILFLICGVAFTKRWRRYTRCINNNQNFKLTDIGSVKPTANGHLWWGSMALRYVAV